MNAKPRAMPTMRPATAVALLILGMALWVGLTVIFLAVRAVL